jgi:hypothetical protein
MKIPLLCTKCAQASKGDRVTVYPAVVRDDGLYELACPYGHKSIIATIEWKFEVLFEIGVYAILDGYPLDLHVYLRDLAKRKLLRT